MLLQIACGFYRIKVNTHHSLCILYAYEDKQIYKVKMWFWIILKLFQIPHIIEMRFYISRE